MKKAHNTASSRFIVLLAVLAGLQLNAQGTGSISGRIVDAETGSPLFIVNVYLANTTIGTTTAQNGYYYLANLPPGTYDMVVHHIGYELEVRSIVITGAEPIRHDFALTPRVIQGEEVVVSYQRRGLLWSLRLARFEREFIGETEYALDCDILNPEVLDFQINPVTRDFTASSEGVLQIENQALGYRIHVIIQEYRSLAGSGPEELSLQYIILPRFEPLEPDNQRTMEKWERNRRLCYEGSLRHFLATLAGSRASSSGYRMSFGGSRKELAPDELQITLDSETRIFTWQLDDWLTVAYQPDRQNSSYISLPDGYTQFDSLGNCIIPYSIELRGHWAQQRMADALPFDYRPGER